MLLEAAKRVGGRWRIEVPHFDAAVSARGHQNVLVVLAPDAVIQPIGCVEDCNLPQAAGSYL